jgi:hypothetical protein
MANDGTIMYILYDFLLHQLKHVCMCSRVHKSIDLYNYNQHTNALQFPSLFTQGIGRQVTFDKHFELKHYRRLMIIN